MSPPPFIFYEKRFDGCLLLPVEATRHIHAPSDFCSLAKGKGLKKIMILTELQHYYALSMANVIGCVNL